MKTEGKMELGVEQIMRDFTRTTLAEWRKFDAENDRRLVDMALRCGDLERQVGDLKVQLAQTEAREEMLREDLMNERNNLVLLTGTHGNA